MQPIISATAQPFGSSPTASPGASLSASPKAAPVKDVTTATFMKDVIEASREAVIVVDFWAPWCGPCKTLGPLLEKAVAETKGAVRMVKINVDENQQLAAQMRIQSIPAVYAFLDGRPVDGFVGALPDSQVKAFVKKLAGMVGGPAGGEMLAEAVNQAKAALTAGDAQTAAAIFAQILQADPENVEALAGLGRCFLTSGDVDKAKQVLAEIPADKAGHADVVALKSGIDLAAQTADLGPLGELMAKLALHPDDHQVRFDAAMALFAHNRREEAIDHLLEIVKRDRTWNDDGARKQLVKFFEALGFNDPLAVAGRKKLSSLLFR